MKICFVKKYLKRHNSLVLTLILLFRRVGSTMNPKKRGSLTIAVR